jgi:hypothetical protein
LAVGEGPDGGHSALDLCMTEATTTFRNSRILWLGSLGYLIALETIGATVCRPDNRFPRNGETDDFIAGAREFAANPISRRDAATLYALRSSLAHAYGLDNTHGGRRYRFVLNQNMGPLILRPRRAWDGSTRPDPVNDMSQRLRYTTSVNVELLADYVEGVVANLRAAHSSGRVRLLRKGRRPQLPEEVTAFRQFFW